MYYLTLNLHKSNHMTTYDITTHHITTHHITTHQITTHHITTHHITIHHITTQYITTYNIISYHISSWEIVVEDQLLSNSIKTYLGCIKYYSLGKNLLLTFTLSKWSSSKQHLKEKIITQTKILFFKVRSNSNCNL